MNLLYTGKHWLKLARWQLRRAQVSRRWGSQSLKETPAVLGNAMPKSGSHLINQVLLGLPQLGPFINPGFPPVNRDEVNDKLPDAEVVTNIQQMRSGDIGYGYLKRREPFVSLLTRPGWASVFVYRDPRDMIVSHVFYATQMHPGHGMHRYYNETLKTMEARINAAIEGVDKPGSELSPILAKYEGYLGWLEQEGVLCLRFEDLILDRRSALDRLLDYLVGRGFQTRLERSQEIEILEKAIAPKKSGTFRKGQPGNWREHFTPANVVFFKKLTGDLLIRLGYEKGADWSL
jgi:hypothetical protein